MSRSMETFLRLLSACQADVSLSMDTGLAAEALALNLLWLQPVREMS